ncbi:MAG: NAD-dependent epimerase/dehydratase [Phycisphaerales bacterium]|nr:NAD-dependent epimerase/dehydratase [Phycisphaerales bacterium]
MTDRPTTAAEVVAQDLDAICANAADELAAMSGHQVLVTGGAGFLGYYLVQSMDRWNRKHDGRPPIRVTVYDNFSRGTPAWLTDLAGRGAVALVKHDMRDPLPPAAGGFAFVVHAASIASPIYYRRDPIGTMDANVNGLRNLLDAFLARKRRGEPALGFLFFSSSEIYGDPDPANIPTREDYRGQVSCTGPRACYDEAKRYGETLCANFFRQHDLPTRCARPFNNFGPGLKITDGRVIPDFARDVFAGRDIVMLSNGSATRTFCYAADSVTGYIKVLVKGHGGEGYNVGTETPEISMKDLAGKVAALGRDLFGYQGKVVTQASKDADYLVDNPNRRCPVIEKARTHLGYDPKVSLDEGLRRTLVWYAENRTAEEK